MTSEAINGESHIYEFTVPSKAFCNSCGAESISIRALIANSDGTGSAEGICNCCQSKVVLKMISSPSSTQLLPGLAIITSDGSLRHVAGGYGYVHWEVGQPRAVVDGEYTAEELRRLTDHMERYSAPKAGEK